MSKKSPHAAEAAVSDQVEAALRRLLSEEVVELTKEGNGGPKCWPAVMLAISLELRNAPRVVQARQQKLQTLDQAVGMVDGTKYFDSLAPKMREACQSRMNSLKHRIEKAGRRC